MKFSSVSLQKVAVVTGANRGLGFAMVRELCKTLPGGSTVFLTARDQKKGHEAVEKLQAEGHNPQFLQLDITDRESIGNFEDEVMKSPFVNGQGLDILINNAGVKLKDHHPMVEQAEKAIRTNYFCTMEMTERMQPLMKPQGRIVNMTGFVSTMALQNCNSSLQTFFRDPNITMAQLDEMMLKYVEYADFNQIESNGFPAFPYGVSKLGQMVGTRILGKRQSILVGRQNVLINCCCPGWAKTDMGGPKAMKTPEQAVRTPMTVANLPPNTTEPQGEFFVNKRVKAW